ncbi:Hcp family type VI secretion system effector [Geomesophilobacter sediminis]|uniref:Type VI secretion system tube protein Hcp n=1 Tax=Geomesophilobacter sediminis TaxID=2798584 RepID=A0A8J7M1C5_9BACT|nr:type VI secretion system tube protein Hcp [Geomesophilobacter sediminis]MBJ6726842.1 type VI secretion system tube protein Hcp [Geomesophilobacter sediminis]
MSQRQLRKFVESATIIAALSLTLTGYSVAASTDMFLKMDGIRGESADDKHRDEIDVLSWSWGITQAATSHIGSGGGAGSADVKDITFTKYVDRSSPILIKNTHSGIPIKNAVFVVRKAGKQQNEFLKIRLEDCFISSITTGGSGGQERLTENVSLTFSRYTFEYRPEKKDGTLDAAVTTTGTLAGH